MAKMFSLWLPLVIITDQLPATALPVLNPYSLLPLSDQMASLLDSLPAYTITNDSTDRTFDANAAAGAITSPPTQAEVENIRDAVLEIADVLATAINDLATKDVLGP